METKHGNLHSEERVFLSPSCPLLVPFVSPSRPPHRPRERARVLASLPQERVTYWSLSCRSSPAPAPWWCSGTTWRYVPRWNTRRRWAGRGERAAETPPRRLWSVGVVLWATGRQRGYNKEETREATTGGKSTRRRRNEGERGCLGIAGFSGSYQRPVCVWDSTKIHVTVTLCRYFDLRRIGILLSSWHIKKSIEWVKTILNQSFLQYQIRNSSCTTTIYTQGIILLRWSNVGINPRSCQVERTAYLSYPGRQWTKCCRRCWWRCRCSALRRLVEGTPPHTPPPQIACRESMR